MDTEALIETYVTPPAAVELVEKTDILLLVGIAGAGKDTIKTRLMQRGDYADIVSHTTRLPRSNNGIDEIDGKDYHFIDMERAVAMVQNNDFIEVKYVHGTIYGTSITAVRAAYDAGKIAVTDLDVQGVAEYKEISQDVRALFVLPPNYATWRERLHKRYATDEAFLQEWPKRRASAVNELGHALEVPYYHFIINDDLDRAVRVVDEIAHRGDAFNRHDDEARRVARDVLESIMAA